MRLVWADEFEGNQVNSTRWNHELLAAGTYNNELQRYTDDISNAYVFDGKLHIRVIDENDEFTSARLNTKDKGDWLYGYFEIRAKMPNFYGTWPAIWTLPTDNKYGTWPNSGEIDIMEYVTCDPDNILGTIHTEAFNHMIGTQIGNTTQAGATSIQEEFHTYKLDWRADQLRVGMDDEWYFTYNKEVGFGSAEWPFDERFHMILNVAVGGALGGYCLDGRPTLAENGIDNTMVVDYVRVFDELKGSGCAVVDEEPSEEKPCCDGYSSCSLGGRTFCVAEESDCVPPSCTDLGDDPWSHGYEIPCCEPYFSCVRPWDQTNWYFRCSYSAEYCDAGEIGGPDYVPPPTQSPIQGPSCTEMGADPYATGKLVDCCAPAVSCLHNWTGDNFHYLCVESDAACEAKQVNDPTGAPSASPTALPTGAPSVTAASGSDSDGSGASGGSDQAGGDAGAEAMPAGVIAGIGAGAAVAVLVAGLLVWKVRRRVKRVATLEVAP